MEDMMVSALKCDIVTETWGRPYLGDT